MIKVNNIALNFIRYPLIQDKLYEGRGIYLGVTVSVALVTLPTSMFVPQPKSIVNMA